MGHRGRVRQTLFLALVVGLALGPEPARNCLQCDPGFAVEFASYIPRLSRKSWGFGDVPAAGRMLRGWAQDTLREIHLDVPLEIPFEELREIAVKIYSKLDAVFNGKNYKPGVLPETLRSIFQEQVSMLRDAIIESRVKCERHCGINLYEAISCETCNITKPSCFGYNCESSKEWEGALKGLYAYITNLKTTPEELVVALQQIPVFSNCTANRVINTWNSVLQEVVAATSRDSFKRRLDKPSLENLDFDSINATLSQNWLTAQAKNKSDEQEVVVELLKPSCPVDSTL